ncbi:MAG: selenocysteine-specific translation elongation factor [Victivallales bacterium]|nr:selenocysteine-specific translation elongation factor [Victivallales bacterium]
MKQDRSKTNFILGTAGHIDHGKTALIKTLTDIQCDTHKEEKKRGITINLGFAYLTHPNGYTIGVIDVPGHKDFINTMVRGVSGINLVLLVIAADSGIMPQTREHLKIINALGVKHGIIVLSKTDLVEPDLVDLAKEEIKELVENTFLKDAKICEVSAKTGKGINNLKKEIYNLTELIINETTVIYSENAPFTMNIDRIISLKGTGTVIAGSVSTGTLNINNSVYLLPTLNKEKAKIRSIQKYKNFAEFVYPGERAAINITGIKKDDLKGKTVLSDRFLRSTSIIDAVITFFDSEYSVSSVTKANNKIQYVVNAALLLGSLNTHVKIHVLFEKKCDMYNNDRSYYVQIFLEKKCITRCENRFILRNTSESKTIGFGKILDPAPLKHRKKTLKLYNLFSEIDKKGFSGIITTELEKKQGVTDYKTIAEIQNFSPSETKKYIHADSQKFTIINRNIIVYRNVLRQKYKSIPNIIKKHHIKLPLSEKGLTTKAIAREAELLKFKCGLQLAEYILNKLKTEGKVSYSEGTWILSTHKIDISPQLRGQIEAIEKYILNCDMSVPILNNLKAYCREADISETQMQQILKHLAGQKRLYFIDDSYIHSKIVDYCRNLLIEFLRKDPGKGITVSEFRDLVKGNRKICLLLLNIYDKEKTTFRKNDMRFLYAEA